MQSSDSFETLEAQIRECFGRAVYSHKIHEKMADSCRGRLANFTLSQIVVTALTSSGAVGVLVFEEVWLKVATAALSFVGLFISTYMKNFDPGGTAQQHRDAATKIWDVRESYLSLLTDMADLEVDEVRARRDELQARLGTIYESAPHTTMKAYAAAQKGLKSNEELTFSAAEIDCFLPQNLKRAKLNIPSS